MTIHRIKLKDLTIAYLQKLQQQFVDKETEIEIRLAIPQQKQKRKTAMSEATFWEIIHTLAWEKPEDNDAILQPAVQQLAQYSQTAILTFHDLLSEKLYLLDGKKFADNASSQKSISADLFLYARCFVVASGKALYYQTLNNASRFPKDMFFDDLLYLPEYAWTMKTGQVFNHLPKYMYETGFNSSGWGEQAITL